MSAVGYVNQPGTCLPGVPPGGSIVLILPELYFPVALLHLLPLSFIPREALLLKQS